VLQSRPITSLYPVDGLESPDGTLHVFLSMGHQQSMTRAMTPVSLSSIQTMVLIGHDESPVDNAYLRASGGRRFADITTPLRHPVLRRPILGLLAQLDVLAPEAARHAMRRPEFRGPHRLRIPLSTLMRAMNVPRRVIGGILWRDLSGVVDRANRLMDDFVEEVCRRYERAPKGAAQVEAVLDSLPTVFPFFLHWVPEAVAGIAATRMLARLAGGLLEPDDVEALRLGIPGNVVNEMNVAIDDLAAVAQSTPELAACFEQLGDDGVAWLAHAERVRGARRLVIAWDRFIARYGMRGPAEIDIAAPRWHEDPLPVLRVIAASLDREPVSQRARQQAYVDQREAAMKKLVERAGGGIVGPLRVRLLKRLYSTMTDVGGMLEHHKFLAVRVLGEVKYVLEDIAGQLVAADVLEDPDDIWYLTWADLTTVWERPDGGWTSLTKNRRAQLARFQRLTPPLIITSDGEAPVVNHRLGDAPDGALLGNPVSSGINEGTTRVIRDPQRESLAPGEVLVAEFTDPGWTPLFIKAGAPVLEVGGALTHGAVVAREYGIPAVVGVRGATATLHTGQRVRVDGNRGVIEVLDGAQKHERTG
jgi:phosphohistidine swiveling domain-containing protein